MSSKQKMPAETASLTTLEGHLERITYYNRDNHFTIAKLRTAGIDQPVTVLGLMPDPNTGEALRIVARSVSARSPQRWWGPT